MAKRFTDSNKFSDVWYRKLPLLQKVIWEFLLAECNHAGILENFDLEMMSFKIGEEITINDLKNFESRIEFLNNTTIFIPKFLEFQYGVLSETCKPHKPVIEKLKKYGLYERVSKGYRKGIDTLEEKEKEKEKDITLNKQIDTLNNINNNEKNLKKSDPYINPINEFFIQEYQKVFEHKPYLMHNQRMKLVELASEIEDFKETIPIALEKLKNIDFKFSNFTPNYIWLLKDDNYIKVLSGTYDRIKTEWEIYDENYEVDEYGN
jgi:hypothetical protein